MSFQQKKGIKVNCCAYHYSNTLQFWLEQPSLQFLVDLSSNLLITIRNSRTRNAKWRTCAPTDWWSSAGSTLSGFALTPLFTRLVENSSPYDSSYILYGWIFFKEHIKHQVIKWFGGGIRTTMTSISLSRVLHQMVLTAWCIARLVSYVFIGLDLSKINCSEFWYHVRCRVVKIYVAFWFWTMKVQEQPMCKVGCSCKVRHVWMVQWFATNQLTFKLQTHFHLA